MRSARERKRIGPPEKVPNALAALSTPDANRDESHGNGRGVTSRTLPDGSDATPTSGFHRASPVVICAWEVPVHGNDDLAQRLESLERELARVRGDLRRSRRNVFGAAATALLALVALGTIQSCAPGTPDTLSLKRLEIVDAGGAVRMVLQGAAIELLDQTGLRAKLSVSGSGPELSFTDPAGAEKATLGLLVSDPVLLMGNVGSEPELQLTVGQNGSGLWLRDRTGRTQADLSVTPHGTQLVLRDERSETTYSPHEIAPLE